jgi:hypothetical protein
MRSDCCHTYFEEATQATINNCRADQGKDMLRSHFGDDCIADGEYTLQELVKFALLNLMHTCNKDEELSFFSALTEAQIEFSRELLKVLEESK